MVLTVFAPLPIAASPLLQEHDGDASAGYAEMGQKGGQA